MFKFGLPTLDKLTGGLKTGQLVIVLGVEKSGKTALCRTICETNFKEHSEEYLIEENHIEPIQTIFDTDILTMGKTATFFSDSEIALPDHPESWKRLESFGRNMREKAFHKDQAVVWAIPVYRKSMQERTQNPEEYASAEWLHAPFSVLRLADTVISCNHKTKNKIYLVKNRHGANRVEINVKFVNNGNDQPIMREVLDA